ncbi:MAG: hypothetical protein HMLKMBBP_00196 [Planctomycetes bacterium]|nr:hypothetical protein [Planctomycetota bacterium]
MRRAMLLLLLFAGAARAGEPSSDLRATFDEIRRRGAWGELLRAADAVLLGAKDDLVGWEFRAYALHKLGRLDEAAAAYDRVTRIDRGHAWAWTQLGNLQVELGRTDEGAASLEIAVALAPESADAWKKLVRALRAGRRWDVALARTADAAEQGIEPAWCAAERATLLWTRGDAAAAKAAWAEARKAGADADACDVGERLVAWDLSLSAPDRMRAANGSPWTFEAAGIAVETRIGPSLPRDVEAALAGAARECAEFLGTPTPGTRVTLVFSRTLDEHEAHRRRLFPASLPGRAFTMPTGMGRGEAGGARIHVHAGRSDLAKTLRHEMSHALLYSRSARRGVPSWLDEGAATHLEDPGPRPDLVATIADAAGRRALPTALNLVHSGPPEFAGADGRLRYALSWALVRHLVASRGAERFRKVVADAGTDVRGGPAAELGRLLGVTLEGLEGELAAAVEAAAGTPRNR